MDAVGEYGGLRLDEIKQLDEVSSGYTYFRDGDVVVAKITPCFENGKGAIAEGLTNHIAFGTTELHVLRSCFGFDRQYLFFLTLSHVFRNMGAGEMYGAGGQKRVPEDFIRNLKHPIPPLQEQQKIAAFLDRETERIDTLIAKKERQVELLKEKRSALVHEAIYNAGTRNLRLGAVADHVCRAVNRSDEQLYVPIGLYNWGRGIFHKEPTQGADLGDSDFFWVKPDDLVISGQFAWEGAVALVGVKEAGCVATHRYPILRGKPGLLDTAYLLAFFTTRTGSFLLNEHSRGAAGRNRPLNLGTLMKETIPVPPMEAQVCVSKHVYFERQFGRVVVDSLELLREYRTALISAAVTGKIDVRKEVA
jgi:type I restriction enzyme S subunit